MDAILTKLIDALNTSVFILLVLLGVVFWLVYKAGGLVEKFMTHEQKLDEARGIQDEMIAIRTKVDLIYQNTHPNALFRAQSPLGLTDKGREVAQTLAAPVVLQRLYPDLLAAVNATHPQTAYDIQAAAFKTAQETLTKLIDEHELEAFKNEAFTRGLLLDDILIMFGILLRDRILAERGIATIEVDRTHPKAMA